MLILLRYTGEAFVLRLVPYLMSAPAVEKLECSEIARLAGCESLEMNILLFDNKTLNIVTQCECYFTPIPR